MISLGIEYEDISAIDQSMEETKSLRDVGLWYPCIPDHHLFLNDYPSLMADYYRPLCWVSFGGPGGKYLQSLTGITVIHRGTPRYINFTYDKNDIPAQCRKLGRYEVTENDEATHFSIDGSSGEIIEAVEVRLRYISGEGVYTFLKRGALMSLKVTQISIKFALKFSSSPPSIDFHKSWKTLCLRAATP